MGGDQVTRQEEIREYRTIELRNQPTTLRRCLGCEDWMHSTGADHRLCNLCKDQDNYQGSRVGSTLKKRERRFRSI